MADYETDVLQYSVGKDKPTLVSSGLLRNGAVGGMTHGNLVTPFSSVLKSAYMDAHVHMWHTYNTHTQCTFSYSFVVVC